MYRYCSVTVKYYSTTPIASQLTFDAAAIEKPEDAGAAEASLLPKFTVAAVGSVVATTDGISVTGAFFVADTDRSTSRIHIAISVRRTNDSATRTICGGKDRRHQEH